MGGMSSARASSFSLGMRFMPPAAREPVAAIYAFCRAADDAVDLDPRTALAGVATWREEVELLFAGAPRHPVMKALHPHVRTLKLKREHFDRIIAGFQMDAAKRSYPSADELYEYCDAVAVAPGRLVLQALGLGDDPKADAYGLELGRGLQLVNILRDLREDMDRGRIYWPDSDFLMMEYTQAEMRKGLATVKYFKLARLEARRAELHLLKAGQLLEPAHKKLLLGPEIMRDTYGILLTKLGKALDAPLDGKPPRLSAFEKGLIAGTAWLASRFG